MGIYLSTVLGYLVLLILSLSMFVKYLRMGLDSSSSVKVDSKPEKNY